MTTAENLNRIIQAKADIKTAIENKGVAVGDLTIDSYAEKIGEIPQDASFSGLDFTVIGYDMALTRELNDKFNADIQYSLQKANEWDENSTVFGLFKGDTKLVYAPLVDTSNVTRMSSAFGGCKNLTIVPLYNTQKAAANGFMFSGCTNLTTVPLFDFSNAIEINHMFSGCANLTEVPLFNTSNATTMNSMFDGCKSLTELPHLDTSKATNVGSMLNGCTNLTTVPLFDFSNVTNITYFFGFSEMGTITTLGGFKDLKIDWNDNYGLGKCPNLTYESVMNVINNLYDFRANGDETTTKKIKFHANSLALLSDDDKAIATNRGWVLS